MQINTVVIVVVVVSLCEKKVVTDRDETAT